MFAQEDLTTLHPASECKTTAESAEYTQQLRAVAYSINSAANCGEFMTEFQTRLRDDVKSDLESNGYTIINNGRAVEDQPVVISWK